MARPDARPRRSCRSSDLRRRSGSAASACTSASGCTSSSCAGRRRAAARAGAAASRLVVLAGPDRGRQGHGRRATSASTTPRCCCRVSRHHAAAAAGRDRRRALLLRQRRAVRPDDRGAASSWSGRRCTTPTATARRGRRSTPALADGTSVLLEIDLQGARQVRDGDARRRCWCSCCRRPGRSWCAGWSAGAPRDAEEQARRLETAKVELRGPGRVRRDGREPRSRPSGPRGRRLDGSLTGVRRSSRADARTPLPRRSLRYEGDPMADKNPASSTRPSTSCSRRSTRSTAS